MLSQSEAYRIKQKRLDAEIEAKRVDRWLHLKYHLWTFIQQGIGVTTHQRKLNAPPIYQNPIQEGK
jgi:hypothetical protein